VPTLIDRHGRGEAVPSAVRDHVLDTLYQLNDPHGVKPIGHCLEAEVMYCVMEARHALR